MRRIDLTHVARLGGGSWGVGHATAQDAALNKSPVGLMSVACHGSSRVSSRVPELRAWSIDKQQRQSRWCAFESCGHKHREDPAKTPQRPREDRKHRAKTANTVLVLHIVQYGKYIYTVVRVHYIVVYSIVL